MEIKFTERAKEYIGRKNLESIYLRLATTSSWSVSFRPVVKEGLPEFVDSFEEHDLGKLKVYYDYALPPLEKILIGYQKVGRRELLVPGDDRD